MISVRTRQGSNALKKIEELRLINKKKNDKIRKQQEEEITQKKDNEEARRIQEEAEKEAEVPISYNIHGIMNGIDSTPTEAMEEDAYNNKEECSPLKKRSGLSKSATRRTCKPQVTPPIAKTAAPAANISSTKSTEFLDTFAYPFP
jgi:hypothetical protein